MNASALDVPAVNPSVPASVRTTNISVTPSERSESDKVRLGDEDGIACRDTDDDEVSGYMVGLTENIIPAECNVDDGNDDEDNDDDKAFEDSGGFTCKEDD